MSGQGPKDGTASSIWVAVDSVELPEKKYFKIGEVAQLVGVEPHVLRYWQTQFPQVRPQKSRSGHRLYRRRDVETLLAVRELLHVQRFTIAGARQALRSLVRSDKDRPQTQPPTPIEALAAQRPAPALPVMKAAATEVALLDVEGLDEGELEDALERELAEATAMEVEEVEVAADAAPLETAPAAALPESSAAALGKLLVERDDAPRVPAALLPSAPATPVAEVMPPTRRARREQLGFGFVPSHRAAIEAARGEVLEILEILDREEAAASRLRTRSRAAKSSS